MQGRGWLAVGAVSAWWLIGASGCVSMSEFDRMKAANRTLAAEKEATGQNLYDERQVNDTLRTKVESLNSELATKNELLVNLRGENDLLDGYRKLAVGTLEDMRGRQQFGDIMIPKLPAALDSALKHFAEEHPSEVAYDAAHGTVKWKADLLFPLGSDEVKSSSVDGLRSFTGILNSSAAADFEVVIVGHTDTRPIQKPQTREKHPTNWHLSAHRAIAVGNAIQKAGYRPERIGCMGCGEYRPIADNSSEAGSELNRRVEIYLVPVGSIVSAGSTLESPRRMESKEAKGHSKSAAPLAAPTAGKPAAVKPTATKPATPAPTTAKPEGDEP
ncbi:MAG: OmpA family protein [Planctomycetes bacterium]|nr:OmpA family protein [Planctomycetota bacterium]MBI3835673.1 OmpA family protein [Planctomycetota bacterium]